MLGTFVNSDMEKNIFFSIINLNDKSHRMTWKYEPVSDLFNTSNRRSLIDIIHRKEVADPQMFIMKGIFVDLKNNDFKIRPRICTQSRNT